MTTTIATNRMRAYAGLVSWLTLCFAVAAIGAVTSVESPRFYAQLQRPLWSPPAWLFGPVWSVLYFLMGLSAWLVWRKQGFGGAPRALGLFLAQLVLNGLWSWLFFAWHRGDLAFFEIVLLWLLIGGTAWEFRRINHTAAALLVPYWLWVGFATVLNYSIWQRNLELLS